MAKRAYGFVRVVWNDSLAFCKEMYKLGEKKTTNSNQQKEFIAKGKKTDAREWLSEVAAILYMAYFNIILAEKI
ncbi:MAG: helix-turn-helix domain-containing protein [Trichodesmium sp. St19_bin2]|nr:helix-turn-helix domain-containing protein [Trichodesmium sp. St4_bin8_1]MDE5091670.1 helix-turn-helix domain-containing protein [Trichodesmium sp. St18_bin3_1_1]MDE5103687.1 helix-turn-helix domain-containing protein [Trichodesmium sp. St19_bin2]